MSDEPRSEDGTDDRHESARRMAEAGLAADRAGDPDAANALIAEAMKVDPDAVADVLSEGEGGPEPTGGSDEELSAESETVVPGSDAPSRAGITGTGSGADGQGL